MKPSCLFPVLGLLISLYLLPGDVYASARSFKAPDSAAFPHPEVVEMKTGRKLIGANGLQLDDYESPGANPAHNPPSTGKKGRGGNA